MIRASFMFCNSSRNILGYRKRRASFILGDSSRNILGNRRRRASFILGNSSRNYILGGSSWPGSKNYISIYNYCTVNIINICVQIKANLQFEK